MPNPRATVCLCMIVKNEASVIERCLRSVVGLIDHWVIVDTGSSDTTQAVVQQTLEALPGKLYQRPWQDFGHNRSEALVLARGLADYVLVLDADERLEAPPGYRFPKLDADAYQILTRFDGAEYFRTQLVKDALDWRYEGVLHEVITCSAKYTEARLSDLVNVPSADGARSRDPDKYAKDAAVLEAALEREPNNTRYAFYLAQSYRDADQPERALTAYARRATMQGYAEETWYSLYQVGLLKQRLGRPGSEVLHAFLTAYQARPTRAEPLCVLARIQREQRQFALAHLFASRAKSIQRPDDALFVDVSTYSWRSLDEYAIAAYWVGDYAEAFAANEKLLRSKLLPANQRARVLENQEFCRARLPAAQASPAGRKAKRPRLANHKRH